MSSLIRTFNGELVETIIDNEDGTATRTVAATGLVEIIPWPSEDETDAPT